MQLHALWHAWPGLPPPAVQHELESYNDTWRYGTASECSNTYAFDMGCLRDGGMDHAAIIAN